MTLRVNVFQTLSLTWFVESAKRYKLKGRSLEELCEHNAAVARDLERHQVGILYHIPIAVEKPV